MSKKPKILVVLGPTASGKSDIAVALAKKFNGEIISADSRQVYKKLNIGTGKITQKETRGVKHYLLDVKSPVQRFTASEYKMLAEKAIMEILNRNKLPIICGGTGFYVDTLLGDKQIPEVAPNLKLREKLEKKTASELFEILKKLDPERAKNIDSKNPRRLVRAIEICEAIGKVPKFESRSMKYEVCKIGIAPQKEIAHPNPSLRPDDPFGRVILREGQEGKKYILDEKELKQRINKRIEKWFKQGLLKEVSDLHKKGLSWKRMSEIGLEYKIISQYLQSHFAKPARLDSRSGGALQDKNKISKAEMEKRMQIETWQYAKRQMTWFKKDQATVWLPPKIKLIEKEVKKFI